MKARNGGIQRKPAGKGEIGLWIGDERGRNEGMKDCVFMERGGLVLREIHPDSSGEEKGKG